MVSESKWQGEILRHLSDGKRNPFAPSITLEDTPVFPGVEECYQLVTSLKHKADLISCSLWAVGSLTSSVHCHHPEAEFWSL